MAKYDVNTRIELPSGRTLQPGDRVDTAELEAHGQERQQQRALVAGGALTPVARRRRHAVQKRAGDSAAAGDTSA